MPAGSELNEGLGIERFDLSMEDLLDGTVTAIDLETLGDAFECGIMKREDEVTFAGQKSCSIVPWMNSVHSFELLNPSGIDDLIRPIGSKTFRNQTMT